jgi:chorismate mutase
VERAAILRRVANFKANQQRFHREREEYFAGTMAKARANQWTPQTLGKR